MCPAHAQERDRLKLPCGGPMGGSRQWGHRVTPGREDPYNTVTNVPRGDGRPGPGVWGCVLPAALAAPQRHCGSVSGGRHSIPESIVLARGTLVDAGGRGEGGWRSLTSQTPLLEAAQFLNHSRN